jgi:hypothetical protein
MHSLWKYKLPQEVYTHTKKLFSGYRINSKIESPGLLCNVSKGFLRRKLKPSTDFIHPLFIEHTEF